MRLEEAVEIVKGYRNDIEIIENYNSKQIAIDALTLDILRGDIGKLKEYKAAAQKIKNYSPEQVAIDALHLALLINPKNNGLLSKTRED